MRTDSVANIIATECEPDWWGNLRGVTKALTAVKRHKMVANNEVQRLGRGERGDEARAAFGALCVAEAELKERKRQLAAIEDEGGAWKRLFIHYLCEEFGEEAFQRINSRVRQEIQALRQVRSVPMSAGSVLAPLSGGGSMKVRR